MCIVVLRAGDHPGRHERTITPLVVASLQESRLRGGQISLGRARGILRILRFDPRHELADRNGVAHGNRPIDEPPTDAKGEIVLILRLDLPAERDRLPRRTVADHYRLHRAGDRGGGRRVLAAT